MLDLTAFTGKFFDVGAPGSFPGITSAGGLTINSGTGNGGVAIDGVYTPAPPPPASPAARRTAASTVTAGGNGAQRRQRQRQEPGR
ncbi:MAG: hypothetical protein U1E60_01745 [Reyranellaceae bacterium]